jgi:hypothetical protein
MEDIQEQKGPKRLIVIGRHLYILKSIRELLSAAGFETEGMLEEYEDIVSRILSYKFDGILISGGVNPSLRAEIKKAIEQQRPDAKFIEHYGGPATIVKEVEEAFNL